MILSVAIITQQGKALVSRQFTNMSKAQITNHLAVFPKLLNKSSQSYVESATIRYVYQEIDSLYFVLITSKDSNILEDLELLSLLVDLTREIIQTIDEPTVLQNALQLILAYDECVFDGYRQSVSVNDVMTFLEMESKEEDEFNMELAKKMLNAQAIMDTKTKELEKKKKEMKKHGFASSGSVGFTPSADVQASGSFTFSNEEMDEIEEAKKEEVSRPKRPLRTLPAGKGMVLGRKTNKRDKAQQMILEEGLTPTKNIREAEESREEPKKPLVTKGLMISLSETVSGAITRLGGIEEFAIKGHLTAVGPSRGFYQIKMAQKDDRVKYRPSGGNRAPEFKRTKTLKFDNREPSDEPTQLLQWMLNTKEEDDLPFAVNCWGTAPGSGRGTTFSLEVELRNTDIVIEQLVLTIPCKRPREATIGEVNGTVEPSEREEVLRWIIPELSEKESTVELEFTVPTKVEDDEFYPIDVAFNSENVIGIMDVEAVALCDEQEQPNWDEPAQCEFSKQLSTDRFLIQ